MPVDVIFNNDKIGCSAHSDNALLSFESFFFSIILFSAGKTSFNEEADLDYTKNWLTGVPSVPSHYCRSSDTYENKKFLYPGTTIANLHAEYQTAAEAAGKEQFAAPDLVKFFIRRTIQFSSHGKIKATFVSARNMVTLMIQRIRLV